MLGGTGRFRLADGEVVQVSGDVLRALYDELWSMSEQRGAVSTAALLLHEWRSGVRAIDLDERQSTVFRLAQSRLAAT